MADSKRKYGLFGGIALVAGSIIGAGVFIKGSDVLKFCNGSLPLSLLAWLIGGLIMVSGGFCFAVYANRIEKFNGCVDYIEQATNKRVGYYFAYFLTLLYFPITVAYVSYSGAGYLVECFTDNPEIYAHTSWVVYIIALCFMIVIFLLNYFAPRISSKFQVSVVFIKIAPLVIIILVGFFSKLIKPEFGIINAFTNPATGEGVVNSFGEAIKVTSFAYDGWISAAAFNTEIKDSKKNLPKAIIIGTIAVILLYLLYFTGISALISNNGVIQAGTNSVSAAFRAIFSDPGMIIVLVMIFISCFGGFNLTFMATSRTLIAIGYRGEGIIPNRISKFNEKRNNFSIYSYIFTFIIVISYITIFYLAYNNISVFKYFNDMDTIVCCLVYVGYITVYVYMMKHFKEEKFVVRFIMPIIAIIGSLFFLVCGIGLFQLVVEKTTESILHFVAFLIMMIILYIPAIILYEKKHFRENKNK